MITLLLAALPELLATLVGVAVGGTIAFATENLRQRRDRHRQAYVILRSLARELNANHQTLVAVLPAFRTTHYGKSYFLQTSAWETALATEELPNIIGFRLADVIGVHYGTLARLRHYGDLLVRVWLTPHEVDGHTAIQSGFRRIIMESLDQAIADHPVVMQTIQDELVRLRGKAHRGLLIRSATPSAFRMELDGSAPSDPVAQGTGPGAGAAISGLLDEIAGKP